MSYCRWSSDNFRCDLYVYANCSGYWTTHVAGNRQRAWRIALHWLENRTWDYIWRHGSEIPKKPDGNLDLPLSVTAPSTIGRWLTRLTMYWPFWLVRYPINGPHDGESFDDAGPLECALRISKLREAGYNCPEHVITALLNDHIEGTLQGMAVETAVP